MDAVTTIAAAGLRANSAAFEASAKRVVEDPDPNLAAELVTQKIAEFGFEANIAVLRAAHRVAKSLLDIVV